MQGQGAYGIFMLGMFARAYSVQVPDLRQVHPITTCLAAVRAAVYTSFIWSLLPPLWHALFANAAPTNRMYALPTATRTDDRSAQMFPAVT